MSTWDSIMAEPLVGPRCPVCHRADGSHALGCPVPEYVSEWKRIHREHSERVVDALFEKPAGAVPPPAHGGGE